MKAGRSKIITIGLSPAWDITCRVEGLDWGQHKLISQQSRRPGGKALNISQALAWMGQKSTAAGLWGQQDYQQMLKALDPLRGLIKVKRTAVDGRTRQNITIVDTANNREMHLRNHATLASAKTLGRLRAELSGIVKRDSVCIFAGAMPAGSRKAGSQDQLLDDVIRIISLCRQSGAKIVLDTSGPALRRIVDAGGLWLIKPNVDELAELLGEQLRDIPAGLAKAGRKLLDKADIVLISRGGKGAVVVTKTGSQQGRCITRRRKILSTVGCGDYLLAGFLKGLKNSSSPALALKTAIKVASARAWGWTEQMSWPQAARQIKVKIDRI